jgi:peptidoglycan/LPS O-acetylase OafA/YrhL
MLKRLEAVMALVVTAGLAIVSYWLFFSWAQGGGSRQAEPAPAPVPQERPADL